VWGESQQDGNPAISAEGSVNKNKAGHNSTRGTVTSLKFFPLKILLPTVYIYSNKFLLCVIGYDIIQDIHPWQ
jgi:hypothetical protein